MEKALIARDGRKSADSGAWEWTCTGVGAFLYGAKRIGFQRPHCIYGIKLGGRGQFSPKIRVFYRRLCYMAEIALKETGSTVISFSPEEEAKLLGVCANTIRKWIDYLIANGVLIPLNRKGGRGKKAQFHFMPKTPQQKVVEYSDYSTTPYGQPAPSPEEAQPTTPATKNTPLPSSNRPKDKDTSTPQKKFPSQQRAEKLRELPDETLLQGKFSNWVMEQFRHRCMDMGFTREESDILCNYVGRLLHATYGQPVHRISRLSEKSIHQNKD